MTIQATSEYQWSPTCSNAFTTKTDIGLVVKELSVIQNKKGEITPALIVKHGKNKRSVFHSYFQWDDIKAAHSWRLSQAARLLSSIEVTVITDGEPIFIKAYEIISKKIGEDVLYSRNQNSVFVIAHCVGDLRRAKHKLEQYSLPEIIKHIDKAIQLLNETTID